MLIIVTFFIGFYYFFWRFRQFWFSFVFDEDGQLEQRENHKDGELNGVVENFYENGQVEIRGNYIDGEQDGLWEDFDRNGNLNGTNW